MTTFCSSPTPDAFTVCAASSSPMSSRTAKGTPIVNFIQLQDGEQVQAILPYDQEHTAKNLLFVTRQGIVKRTPVAEFKNINRTGKIAISPQRGRLPCLHPADPWR